MDRAGSEQRSWASSPDLLGYAAAPEHMYAQTLAALGDVLDPRL